MTNPRPVRTGGLTILVFMLVQPLGAGLLFAGLSALGGAFGEPPPGVVFNPLLGLLFGVLIQLPGAGFTGFIMAILSHRIRSMAGWLWSSAFVGAGLAFLIILVPMRAIFADETLAPGLFFAALIAVFGGLGAFAAAGAALKLRSRPWMRPAAEAFD